MKSIMMIRYSRSSYVSGIEMPTAQHVTATNESKYRIQRKDICNKCSPRIPFIGMESRN